MTRRFSPVDCRRIVGIQHLSQTLAANELANARASEDRATEQLETLAKEVEAGIGAWSAHLVARLVDLDQLQRLAGAISADVEKAAAAAKDLDRTREESELCARRLEIAGANVKQAEALARKVARQASRRAEEAAMQAAEERASLAREIRR